MRVVLNFFGGIFVLFKKDAKLYGSKIISLVLLLALLICAVALALGAMIQSSAEDGGDSVLSMAIYDKEPSTVTSSAISIVSRTEAVKELFTVKMCDSEEEVRDGIKNGSYDAALVFSEGYYTKILKGDDSAVTILVSDKLSSTIDLIENFATTGELLISLAEAGVEGVYPPVKEMHPDDARGIIHSMEKKFAMKLFALPTESFKIEIVPYSEMGATELNFYFICFTAFLLLLCEVLFFPYTAKDCEFSMLRRIKSYRISNLSIIVEKSLMPFIIRSLLLFTVVTLLGNITDVDISAKAVGTALLCLWLVSLFMSSLTVLLSQTKLGLSVIFALCSASLILAGGIIPQTMMPHEVATISSLTPMWHCMQMTAPLFDGNFSLSAPIYLAALTATAMFFACIYMRRICKGGGER